MPWGEASSGAPPQGGQTPPPGVMSNSTASPPRSKGILSPSPLGLDFQPGAIPWPQSYSTDLTTGAPQKLFRYLLDSLAKFGFAAILRAEPNIMGQAIGDTGTT